MSAAVRHALAVSRMTHYVAGRGITAGHLALALERGIGLRTGITAETWRQVQPVAEVEEQEDLTPYDGCRPSDGPYFYGHAGWSR